jgi:hypothetical protein
MLAFGDDADAEQVFDRLVREFDPPLRLGLLRQAMCALLVFSGMIAGIWFGGVTGILVSEWDEVPVRGPQGGALYAVYFFLFEDASGSTIIVNSAMLLGFIAGVLRAMRDTLATGTKAGWRKDLAFKHCRIDYQRGRRGTVPVTHDHSDASAEGYGCPPGLSGYFSQPQ